MKKGTHFNHTELTKKKIKEHNVHYWKDKKRKSFTEEHKKSIIKNLNPYATKGMKFPNRRKPSFDTEQRKIRIGEGLRKAYKEGRRTNYKGGICFDPYPIDWTETLKKAIREKYHYICQVCNEYAWVVHHIDYDKNNCNLDNLIVVCRSCHAKTNFNRNYWINYFNNKL